MCSRVGIDTSNLIRIDGHHDNVARKLAHLGYLLSEVQIFYDHYFGADRNYNGMRVTQIIIDDPFVPARDDTRPQPLSREIDNPFVRRPQPLSREMFDRLTSHMDSMSFPPPLPTPYEILGIDQKCPMCKYYSGSKHLRCTPNPAGDALQCPHFEEKQ
jgi:hypothetical protein